MWTTENRARYDRNHLRYPSDLTDAEWALIEPCIPPAKRGGNKRSVNVREIVNGLIYILSTGCQWRAIPKDPAATLDAVRLFRSVELGRHAPPHPSCALCRMSRTSRARVFSDGCDHRQALRSSSALHRAAESIEPSLGSGDSYS
jgi:Putative transposase of IS4/5 family (DUF4096)